jgi:hypothetical protein
VRVAKKTRLGLYLEDEQIKTQIKIAAAKRGTTVTNYCAQAIEERLIRDGERRAAESKLRGANAKTGLLARMDPLRQEIGPIGRRTSGLVEQGRRRIFYGVTNNIYQNGHHPLAIKSAENLA